MQSKELKSWDRRPWPQSPDTDENTLYAAIGRALSMWERYEAELALVFSMLVTERPSSRMPAELAYCAVRTFEGRADMLRAASRAYFYGHGFGDEHALVKSYKAVLSSATSYSPRRNEIAHGLVDVSINDPELTGGKIEIRPGYAMYPPYGAPKVRDPAGIPAYCYTSTELEYFAGKFAVLRRPAHTLAAELSVTNASLRSPQSR